MIQSNSYVYFAFRGDNFDPDVLTQKLQINPSDSWRTGDPGKYIQQQKNSCWMLKSTENELLNLDKLVEEVIAKLSDKVEMINILKKEYNLETILEIIMYVDVNEEQSTPWISHNKQILNFLYFTGTTTDLDIYRYNSNE